MTHKIMVIEDDRPILELMDLLIRKLGYEPVLESDGLAAIERIQKDPPALVLLDIMMVPVDGLEILKRLRAEEGTSDLPVIFFTAAPEAEERVAEFRDPRIGMLHKPVSLSELREAIRTFLPPG